ncbi:MAG: sigma factor G inhibitor Gin [Bacillota bacterium]|nr:sigma factor G inhibitor Gin [Bacillota bacterium]
MAGRDQKNCLCCGSVKGSGITVLSSFICLDCEQEIISASFHDRKYGRFIEILKEIWSGLIIEDIPETDDAAK